MPQAASSEQVLKVFTPSFWVCGAFSRATLRKSGKRDRPRISMNLKMDDRRGDQSRMASKIDAVETRLGRSLSTG